MSGAPEASSAPIALHGRHKGARRASQPSGRIRAATGRAQVRPSSGLNGYVSARRQLLWLGACALGRGRGHNNGRRAASSLELAAPRLPPAISSMAPELWPAASRRRPASAQRTFAPAHATANQISARIQSGNCIDTQLARSDSPARRPLAPTSGVSAPKWLYVATGATCVPVAGQRKWPQTCVSGGARLGRAPRTETPTTKNSRPQND